MGAVEEDGLHLDPYRQRRLEAAAEGDLKSVTLVTTKPPVERPVTAGMYWLPVVVWFTWKAAPSASTASSPASPSAGA